jgi:hypothetical protein
LIELQKSEKLDLACQSRSCSESAFLALSFLGETLQLRRYFSFKKKNMFGTIPRDGSSAVETEDFDEV